MTAYFISNSANSKPIVSVVKSSIRHQTTAPLSRVGPTTSLRDSEPDFTGPINNVTVPLSREAVLTCSVSDLGDYKVSKMLVVVSLRLV